LFSFLKLVKEKDDKKRKAIELFHATLSPADKVRRSLKEERSAEDDLKRLERAAEQKKTDLAMIKERRQREEEEWKEQEMGEAIQKTLESLLKDGVYEQFVKFIRDAMSVTEFEDPIASLQKAVVQMKEDFYHPI
jgi:hypothetical protein